MKIKSIVATVCALASVVLISGCAGGYLSEDTSMYRVGPVHHNSALTDFKTHYHGDDLHYYHHMNTHHLPHNNVHYYRPYYDGYHYYGWNNVPNTY